MTAYSAGNKRTIAITAVLFAAALGAPISNTEGDVATLRTADGHMTVLRSDTPLRMYLHARYQMPLVASVAAVATVQVNGNGRRMVRSPRAGRTFPSTAHPDVLVYTTLDGNTWQLAPVTAADFEAGSVSYQKPANATGVRVYYTFGDGEIVLRGSRPLGSSGGSVQLWNYPARSLHELNQADTSAAPVLGVQPVGMPQGFTLSIAVRAFSAVYFDAYARHEINIPAYDLPISVSDPVQLAALGEMGLKGL